MEPKSGSAERPKSGAIGGWNAEEGREDIQDGEIIFACTLEQFTEGIV
jgi:hypothetical protein